MTLKMERFEAFPNATTFNTTNAGTFGETTFANISSNANTFATQTSDSAHGSSCLAITGVSATGGQFDITDTASASGVTAFMFKLTATPTVAAQFPLGVRQSAGALGRIEINTSRQLRCNLIVAGTYGTALALNTWYRIEVICTGMGTASSAMTYNVYVGDATGTPFATDTVSGQTTAAQMDRFRYYRLSTEATVLSCKFDTIRQNIGSSTPLGPYQVNNVASDSATLSEGTTAVTQIRDVTDSATLSETITDVLVTDLGGDDQTLSEGTTVLAASSAVTDTQTQNTEISSLVRSSAVSDTQTQNTEVSSLLRSSAVTDTQTQNTETSSLLVTFAVNDTATQTEGTTDLTQALAISVSDTQTQNTEISSLLASSLVTDSATQSEGTAALDQSIVVSDSAIQSEGATALLASSAVNDVATQGESPTLLGAAFAVTDSWTLTDNSSLNAGGNFTANDSAVQAEGTAVVDQSIGVNDSATQTDASSLVDTTNIAVNDAATQSEGTAQTDRVALVNDSLTLTDVSALTDSTSIAVNDSAIQSDASTLNAGDNFSVSDAETLNEVAVLAAAASVVDSAVQSESGFLGVTGPAFGNDSATQSDSSSLSVTIILQDNFTQLDMVSGFTSDTHASDQLVQLDASSVTRDFLDADDRFFLVTNRDLTKAYIDEQPVSIVLQPYTRNRVDNGGFIKVAAAPRVVQIMRIIESSSIAVTDPARTETGFQRTRSYQLMAEFDALMAVDDTFVHEGANWKIISFMPYNGYERRAVVERIGA